MHVHVPVSAACGCGRAHRVSVCSCGCMAMREFLRVWGYADMLVWPLYPKRGRSQDDQGGANGASITDRVWAWSSWGLFAKEIKRI